MQETCFIDKYIHWLFAVSSAKDAKSLLLPPTPTPKPKAKQVKKKEKKGKK